jgi:chemotaxis response regulator CheB
LSVKQPESEKLGVLTIGFSPVVRAGLQSILSKDETIKVIGDAPDGEKAIQVIL